MHPLDDFDLRRPQRHLSLRFDHKPFWPAIGAVLGGTQTLAAIVIDLVLHDGWVSYSRAARHYDMARRYRNSLYTWRLVVDAMDRLDALGFIDHDRREPGPRGWQSAARARPELRGLILGIIGRLPVLLARPAEVVVLRDAAGRNIDYRDIRCTDRMRKNIDRINEGIAGIGLPPNLNAPIRRIFNCDFSRGGRAYAVGGAWQSLPQEERAALVVGGEPVVELDYRGLHPSLLYAEAGVTGPADAYDLPGWPRPLVKVALLVLLNARSRKSAIAAIARQDEMAAVARPETFEAMRAARDLTDEIMKVHAPIAHNFGKDAGARLMRRDADIAEAVMLDMISTGEPVLPVHDSFLVRASKKDELERAMIDAGERIAGTALAVA